jgi:prepilin-type N-terminal cleavage/methylation domain-containing protein
MRARGQNTKPTKGAKHAGCVPACAFTLIESLAVVALLAIAVSTLAVGLAPSADLAAIRDARSAVLDADARARVLARQGRVVLLSADENAVWAHDAADPRETPLVRRPLPEGVSVSIRGTPAGEPLKTLRIDADGRSGDYLLTVLAGNRASETVVAGLTGYAFGPRPVGIGGGP